MKEKRRTEIFYETYEKTRIRRGTREIDSTFTPSDQPMDEDQKLIGPLPVPLAGRISSWLRKKPLNS